MKKRSLHIIFLFLIFWSLSTSSNRLSANPSKDAACDSVSMTLPDILVTGVESRIDFHLYRDGKKVETGRDTIPVQLNGNSHILHFLNGEAGLPYQFEKSSHIIMDCPSGLIKKTAKAIPLWMSILPPLIAIMFALVFKEVFSALFLGLFSGTFIIQIFTGIGVVNALFKAFLRLIDTYIIEALKNPDHLAIIVFSMLIGGMVGIVTKNGGMKGIVTHLSKRAKTARSGQIATWLMGIAIFFDDYANTLVVGNTMRAVTDRLKISREKLAYIVDSTAAPIASVAFITTWIGAELSYISDGIVRLGLDSNPYSIFFSSLKYSFYPIFTLAFVFMLVMMRREYGPMYNIELKARRGERDSAQKSAKTSQPRSPAYNAVIPVAVIIFGTLGGLLYTGWDTSIWENPALSFSARLSHTIGGADSFKALLWASLAGVIVAIVMSMAQKLLNLKKTMESMTNGFKSMLPAIMILSLAWALAAITKDMHTADFISDSMQRMNVDARFVPALSFIFSALIAFSTGSSWGTMAIMYPLILPSAWAICISQGMDDAAAMAVFSNVVSTVIAGSVLGDHCSPISDTTILSSLASGCNHIQHVRTQMPYALTGGLIAVGAGTIPAAFGMPFLASLPVGLILIFLILRIFGKKLPKTELSGQADV